MGRYSEDHKLWLFDLAHGNLKEPEIVKGFIRYYALEGLVLGNVKDDIVFKTSYGLENTKRAVESLRAALERFSLGN